MNREKTQFDNTTLDQAFQLLAERMENNGCTPVTLVVCGGSALIATRLVSRITKDVDVVALASQTDDLLDPEPLPGDLQSAAN